MTRSGIRALQGRSIWRGLLDGAFAIAALQLIQHLTKPALPLADPEATPSLPDETASLPATGSGNDAHQVAYLADALLFPETKGAVVAESDTQVPFPTFLPVQDDDLGTSDWPAASTTGASAGDPGLQAQGHERDMVSGLQDRQVDLLI